MSKSVISTLPTDTAYTVWIGDTAAKGAVPRRSRAIVVKGGHGVANKNFITPQGVATVITDDEAEALAKHKVFLRHQKRGYVKILNKEEVVQPEKELGDLNAEGDKSTPPDAEGLKEKTGQDVEENTEVKVKRKRTKKTSTKTDISSDDS